MRSGPPNEGKLTRGQAKLTGVGTFDVKSGQMLSLTLLFDGTYRSVDSTADRPVGAVVEWQRDHDVLQRGVVR